MEVFKKAFKEAMETQTLAGYRDRRRGAESGERIAHTRVFLERLSN